MFQQIRRLMPACARTKALLLIALTSVILVQGGSAVYAKPANVRIFGNGEITFGTFMVFGSGARTVSSSGNVTDQSIVALEGIRPRPARFTIEFDRGNESRRVMNVEVELVISAPAKVRLAGVEATLSRFETDLPGYVQVSAGEAIQVSIDNCRTRICSKSFSLGGRLDVTRNFGGASISIPINLDARVVEIERQ